MDSLVTFTSVALLALAVYTFQNLVRYLRAGDWNGVLGIVLAWAGGFVAALLAANASVTETLVLVEGGQALGNLDFGALVLVGLGLGSGASAFADYRAARDNNDSATKPNLVP